MLDFAIFAVTFLLALVGAVLYLYPVMYVGCQGTWMFSQPLSRPRPLAGPSLREGAGRRGHVAGLGGHVAGHVEPDSSGVGFRWGCWAEGPPGALRLCL